MGWFWDDKPNQCERCGTSTYEVGSVSLRFYVSGERPCAPDMSGEVWRGKLCRSCSLTGRDELIDLVAIWKSRWSEVKP